MSANPDFAALDSLAPEEDHDETAYAADEAVPQDNALFDLDENTASDDHDTEVK